MPENTPTLSRGMSREERKMQRIMEQFRAMEEREKKKKIRAQTPSSTKKAKKSTTTSTQKRKLEKSQQEATPKKKRIKREENTNVIEKKINTIKKKTKTIEVKKKQQSAIKVKKKITQTPAIQKTPVQRVRPPPRDRSVHQKDDSDKEEEETKKTEILISDDTKHLPKKRYILLVDSEIGQTAVPSFPFKKRWKHQGSLKLNEKVNSLLDTADKILGKVSYNDRDSKNIADSKVKRLLVTGPISTSPAIAAFRSDSNPPPLHLN